MMGIEDRDWYNPKQYRKDPSDNARQKPPGLNAYLDAADAKSSSSNWWQSIITWGFLLVALYFAFAAYLKQRTPQPSPHPIVQASARSANTCPPSALPANGAVQIVENAVMRRSDVPYSGLSFENRHSTAITATILHGEKKIASVLALPGQIAELAAPVGQYSLKLAWGTKWCGQQRDFDDQHLVSVNGGITSQEGQKTVFLVESDSIEQSGLRLTNVTKALPTPVPDQPTLQISSGELVVKADRSGHFRIPGKVNERPVTFMVDTGASVISISRKMANEVGLYNCSFGGFANTANGRIDVCIAKGITIEFGNFRVPNIDVNILPNMEDEVLLGMSVLKYMQMQQSNGVLRLTSR